MASRGRPTGRTDPRPPHRTVPAYPPSGSGRLDDYADRRVIPTSGGHCCRSPAGRQVSRALAIPECRDLARPTALRIVSSPSSARLTAKTARSAETGQELSGLNVVGGRLLVTASCFETVRAVMSQSNWWLRTRGSCTGRGGVVVAQGGRRAAGIVVACRRALTGAAPSSRASR
jgi:hypothetical protein